MDGWKEVGNLLGSTGLHFGIKNKAKVAPKPAEIQEVPRGIWTFTIQQEAISNVL